jgi:dipeptidyl-peptidase-3
MRKYFILFGFAAFLLIGCSDPSSQSAETTTDTTSTGNLDDFDWNPENFSDKKIVRYQMPGFDKLTLDQKKLVYYLVQAGLAGRDISYDQNYRHNLAIRHSLEHIINNYSGDKEVEEWKNLMLYAKEVWFASGIHHHYSSDKFLPGFSSEYYKELMEKTGATLSDEAFEAMFIADKDAKKVNLDPEAGLVIGSAVNFYDPDITEAEVDAYYASIKVENDPEPIEYGLNSKLVRGEDGKLKEKVYSANGMYGAAIKEMIKWLEKAVTVAENEPQGNALKLLIEYLQTGDLRKWSEYNIAWTKATEGDIDYIMGFVEVYQDPKGYTGSYETIVQITDFDASERMAVVANNGQWFEDNSTTMPEHKKKEVVGISYKVVTVAGESGDASPSTPIGVNLPNAPWIRALGSKSVSLGNIIHAYAQADGPGMLDEFAHDTEEKNRAEKYGGLAGKMHTALHEVIGHASGKLEEGVATPKETLKNYSSPLEEARADLVGLYFIMDPKLVELGLVESDEVGKAEYDSYIKNGMMLQLRRLLPGKTIQQAHMRNRATVAHWVYEKGKTDNVIDMVKRDGKTYFEITDYQKLRALFGELLREVQRITSQGDYEAGKNLIETYGVQVDREIHDEVLARSERLNIPPYGGFINPKIVPVTNSTGEITDFKVEYPDDFTEQMLEYGKNFSFLPDVN